MAPQRTPVAPTEPSEKALPFQAAAGLKRTAAANGRSPRLYQFHEIPLWQKDSEYLLSGYRPTSASVWGSIASLSYLNNQTVNTYSHLIGAIAFVLLPFYFYRQVFVLQQNARTDDLVVVSIYCFAVAVCFMFSATFHLMRDHSQAYAERYISLDYLGILVLMWGASIPTIYYGFYCDHSLQ